MSNTLEVMEYDTITCNSAYKGGRDYKYLDEKHFKELNRFVKEYNFRDDHADVLDFMKVGYKRPVGDVISVNNYVGVIELPSGFQIEILPKILFDEDSERGYSSTKKVVLEMLRCLKDFDGKALSNAALSADRMNLYEIFIKMYIEEAKNLVKHGIKSAYVTQEDNLHFYKGKLIVSQHIKSNLSHRERFYMQYDEYMVDRAENRLVKAVLLKLQKLTTNYDNSREIRQLLIAFELVGESVNYDKDLSQVSMGRDLKDYRFLIQWAKIFLKDKSFTSFSGDKTGKALLFPMERLFEVFVAHWIRNIFSSESLGRLNVSKQDSRFFLFDEPRVFRLRPDIVIKNHDDEKIVVLDTKWKKLSTDLRTNYGISQADMYQMYAYAKKYQTSEIWLIYPKHPEVLSLQDLCFNAIREELREVHVHIFFVDLANYKESIKDLYDRIYNPALSW